MTRPGKSAELEKLIIEARDQFSWAKDENEHHPEGLAFLFEQKVMGGRARNVVRQTAVADALHHLPEIFATAALKPHQRPDCLVVVTEMCRESENPRQPSPSLLRDARKYLKKSPDHPLRVIVVGDKGGEFTCEI